MSNPRLVLDGRWVRTCPQFNPIKLVKRRNPVLHHIQPSRKHSSSPLHPNAHNNLPSAPASLRELRDADRVLLPSEGGGNWLGIPLPPYEPSSSKPTKLDKVRDLESKLQKAAERPDLPLVVSRLRELIGVYQQEPTAEYYESWILGNCDPQYGSAAALRHIWEELTAENIPVGSSVFHAFLKALSYHPDYLLRSTVLERMEQRWIGLNHDGWNDIVVGLLKESQLAPAVDKIQQMRSSGIPIHRWVYSAVLHCLITVGEFPEALMLMDGQAQDGTDAAPLTTWTILLQEATHREDCETIRIVWNRMVHPGYLNPSSGICEKILITAARTGDFDLAGLVFQTLAQRKDSASIDTCEPMLSCFLQSDHSESFIRLVCAMQDNGLEPGVATLRMMVEQSMHSSTSMGQNFEQLLRQLSRDEPLLKQTVPIELLNSVMEIHLRFSKPQLARKLFVDRLELCAALPNLRTYSLLFEACRQLQDLESVWVYYDEMRRTLGDNVRDERIITILVDTCIDAGDFTKALASLVAGQDNSISIKPATIDRWMRRVQEDSNSTGDLTSSFTAKLTNMKEGEEVRKEIEALSRTFEETNPFTAAREAEQAVKKAEKPRQAKAAWGNRRYVKTRKAQERHASKEVVAALKPEDHMKMEVDTMLTNAKPLVKHSSPAPTRSRPVADGLEALLSAMDGKASKKEKRNRA